MTSRSRNSPASPGPDVLYRKGIHLLGSVLWFDAVQRRDLCFISNARVPRPGQHRKVLCHELTARILASRGSRIKALAGPYGQRIDLGPLRLEMVPSGHMLGGAQLLIQRGRQRVLYAGTVCTEPLPTTPRLENAKADLLVVRAGCAPPGVAVPSRAEAEKELLDFVETALAAGETPVLLVTALGQGQDVLYTLGNAGLRVLAHRTLYRNALAYRECDVRFRGVQRFRGRVGSGEVLVYPRSRRQTTVLARLAKRRIATVGLRGPDDPPDEAEIRYLNVSSAEALLSWIRHVGAQRNVLYGAHDQALVNQLTADGVEARALSDQGQLDLPLL